MLCDNASGDLAAALPEDCRGVRLWETYPQGQENHDSCAGMGSQERVGTKDSPKDPLVEREVPCSASHARPAIIERGLPSARHECIASNMFRFCS